MFPEFLSFAAFLRICFLSATQHVSLLFNRFSYSIMSKLNSSPGKRKPDAKEGVFFKKIKVVPKLKLTDAILQRDQRSEDGFVEGEASLEITGLPEHFTLDRCPEYFQEDKKKRPCLRTPVRFELLHVSPWKLICAVRLQFVGVPRQQLVLPCWPRPVREHRHRVGPGELAGC
jgi:hypothetical protein